MSSNQPSASESETEIAEDSSTGGSSAEDSIVGGSNLGESNPENPSAGAQSFQREVVVTGQWAVLAQVAEACDLPREELIAAANKGAVWLQKSVGKRHRKPVRIRSFDQVVENDRVLVNYAPDVLAMTPAVPVLVSDEKNYSVWDKPAGLLSQGSKWSDHCTITSQVEKIHKRKALLVHRLDRAARGLIVIAHTKNAVAALAELFANRKVDKTYRAVVKGEYKEELPVVIELPVDGKPAHTEILYAMPLETEQDRTEQTRNGQTNKAERTELTVKIKTGRKHQIRSHLAHMGYPVVGDRLFDSAEAHVEDLQLVASELQFVCPFSNKNCHYHTSIVRDSN